jgi:hypothetical protein
MRNNRKCDFATSTDIKVHQGLSREIKDTLPQSSLHASWPAWPSPSLGLDCNQNCSQAACSPTVALNAQASACLAKETQLKGVGINLARSSSSTEEMGFLARYLPEQSVFSFENKSENGRLYTIKVLLYSVSERQSENARRARRRISGADCGD